MELREPRLIAVCGKKGVGKTYTSIIYIRKYVKGNPAKGIPGRKVLIFDVNDEYSDKLKYPDIRAIKLEDVPLFSSQNVAQIRRVAPIFSNGITMTLNDMAQVLQWILRQFRNGLLLVEDINKYVGDAMPSDLIGALCTNRHTGVDIMLHYQSIGRLLPKVWQNINVIRMHKNTDSVDRHQNKFTDKYECLKIAEKIIITRFRSGDTRFYLFVDFDNEKVYAEDLKKREVQAAITDYVAENTTTLVNPKLAKVAANGSKIYTMQKAFKEEEDRIFEQYFL